MRTSCVKNGLIVGVILLFIGVGIQPAFAIAPNINANISKEMVEITTEICGLNGNKQTVKLSREDADEIILLFTSIEEQLNNTNSVEEAVEIFDKAILELDRFGVLPTGMSVKEMQKLVTGRYKNPIMMMVFDEIKSIQQQPFDNDENFLCLIAGTLLGGTLFLSLWNDLFYKAIISVAVYFSFILFELIFLFIPIILVTAMIDIINPICMGRYIYFSESEKPQGIVASFGLNGLKVWRNKLTGLIYHWFLQYVGTVGFVGLKLQLLNYKDVTLSLFLGFSPWVKIKEV